MYNPVGGWFKRRNSVKQRLGLACFALGFKITSYRLTFIEITSFGLLYFSIFLVFKILSPIFLYILRATIIENLEAIGIDFIAINELL